MPRPTRLAFIALILFLASIGPAAAQVTVFDGTFSRLRGKPVTTHTRFAGVNGRATIKLYNGGIEHSAERRVSAATIRLNGSTVFDEMQFNQRMTYLEKDVDLLDVNDLEVFLRGKPDGTVAIRIVLLVPEDIEAIQQFWQVLQDLYATSQPGVPELTGWFNANVAADFVDGGRHHAEELAAWIAGSGPMVGMTLSPVVTKLMDVTGTAYTKGYQIRLEYAAGGTSGSLLTYMVFDGSHWLWYGDQEWVHYDLAPHMSMVVDVYGAISFETGLGITLWDGHDCSAYRYGARSAIVTGPGLPAEGTKLYHMYPLPYFRLYPYDPMNSAGNWYVLLDDVTIGTIPDGAHYTIRLYSEPPETVSLANTPLTSFVKTNPRRPLLSTELNASLFPTLLEPVTHKSSDLEPMIGGFIEVRWMNPENMKVTYVGLGLTPDSQSWAQVGVGVTPGETSASLDTRGFAGYHTNGPFLIGSDDYARGFSLMWRVFPWW